MADDSKTILENLLERLGYEIVAVPEDDQGLRPELLDRKLEELGTRRREISFFYVVTVNNPTSTILANKRRRELITTVERVSRELQRPVPLIHARDAVAGPHLSDQVRGDGRHRAALVDGNAAQVVEEHVERRRRLRALRGLFGHGRWRLRRQQQTCPG